MLQLALNLVGGDGGAAPTLNYCERRRRRGDTPRVRRQRCEVQGERLFVRALGQGARRRPQGDLDRGGSAAVRPGAAAHRRRLRHARQLDELRARAVARDSPVHWPARELGRPAVHARLLRVSRPPRFRGDRHGRRRHRGRAQAAERDQVRRGARRRQAEEVPRVVHRRGERAALARLLRHDALQVVDVLRRRDADPVARGLSPLRPARLPRSVRRLRAGARDLLSATKMPALASWREIMRRRPGIAAYLKSDGRRAA